MCLPLFLSDTKEGYQDIIQGLTFYHLQSIWCQSSWWEAKSFFSDAFSHRGIFCVSQLRIVLKRFIILLFVNRFFISILEFVEMNSHLLIAPIVQESLQPILGPVVYRKLHQVLGSCFGLGKLVFGQPAFFSGFLMCLNRMSDEQPLPRDFPTRQSQLASIEIPKSFASALELRGLNSAIQYFQDEVSARWYQCQMEAIQIIFNVLVQTKCISWIINIRRLQVNEDKSIPFIVRPYVCVLHVTYVCTKNLTRSSAAESIVGHEIVSGSWRLWLGCLRADLLTATLYRTYGKWKQHGNIVFGYRWTARGGASPSNVNALVEQTVSNGRENTPCHQTFPEISLIISNVDQILPISYSIPDERSCSVNRVLVILRVCHQNTSLRNSVHYPLFHGSPTFASTPSSICVNHSSSFLVTPANAIFGCCCWVVLTGKTNSRSVDTEFDDSGTILKNVRKAGRRLKAYARQSGKMTGNRMSGNMRNAIKKANRETPLRNLNTREYGMREVAEWCMKSIPAQQDQLFV